MSSNISGEAVHEQASEEKTRQGRGPASCPLAQRDIGRLTKPNSLGTDIFGNYSGNTFE